MIFIAEEKTIWKGSPSQIVNIEIFLTSLLLFIPPFILLGAFPNMTYLKFLYIIPIYIIILTWLETKYTTYEFTTKRILTTSGVFSRTKDELRLYRVKDRKIKQPLFLRLFSLENVIIYTSDITNNTKNIINNTKDKEFTLKAVPQSEELGDKVSEYSEKERDKKGVKEIDIGSIKGSINE
ncbi:MAG: PH domain-containing protein [Candidatus Aenigmarchaeota archaeon]|nr:PH domain-containing protein [Candidatus Aenigmarchaeota archaeon]